MTQSCYSARRSWGARAGGDGRRRLDASACGGAITDQNLGGGWLGSSGAEIGDKCAWIARGNPGGVADLSVATGTFAVQSMWANDANSGTGGCETSHPIITGPDVITVTNPGPQFSKLGHSVSLQIRASATSGSPLGYGATGLPPGLAINSAGLISGTPTKLGTYSVNVTAVDRNDTQGSAAFTWAVRVF